MQRRKLFAFAIDPDLAVGLKRVKERDGVSESEQVRRAIRQWLLQRDGLSPPAPEAKRQGRAKRSRVRR